MEEKRIRYWFRGNKKHGRELIGRLVEEFGAINSGCYGGTDEGAIYFVDGKGTISSIRKRCFDEEGLKDYCIESTKVVEDDDVTKVEDDDVTKVETIPAEKLKPTSTVVTAPFYMVCSTGFVMPDKYSSYEDAKTEAKRLAEKHKVKTYVLAPFAKFTLTAYEAPFDDSDKIMKGN